MAQPRYTYRRSFFSGYFTTGVKWLLIVNTAVFILTGLLSWSANNLAKPETQGTHGRGYGRNPCHLRRFPSFRLDRLHCAKRVRQSFTADEQAGLGVTQIGRAHV